MFFTVRTVWDSGGGWAREVRLELPGESKNQESNWFDSIKESKNQQFLIVSERQSINIFDSIKESKYQNI